MRPSLRRTNQALHVEGPVVKRPKAIALDKKENFVGPQPKCAEVRLPSEGHRPLLYKSEAPWLGSLHSFFVVTREPSSSVMTSERWSKKVVKRSPS